MGINFKHEELTSKIIAASISVHSSLKAGFQEIIYQRALEIELTHRSIPALREFNMPIFYRGVEIGTRRVDFFVDKKVSVELKAVAVLDNTHLAQALNYLEAYNIEVGLLINFGAKSLEFKRLLNRKFNEGIHNPNQ